jgi:hypothetical protein
MVKCADCGFLAVRHLDTQTLVAPVEAQRRGGKPPPSSGAWANLDTTPICAVGAVDLGSALGGPGKAHWQKLVLAERTCEWFTQWIPACSPKEHLEMNLLKEQREWQAQQASLAEERHAQAMRVQLRSQLIAAIVGFVGALVAVWLAHVLR